MPKQDAIFMNFGWDNISHCGNETHHAISESVLAYLSSCGTYFAALQMCFLTVEFSLYTNPIDLSPVSKSKPHLLFVTAPDTLVLCMLEAFNNHEY